MSSATVSVVVTCHNLGRYLNEALDSVFEQTYQDFEVIVVDDGSTDPETIRIVQTLDRPRTRVVRIANRGLPGARNEGIRQSSGRFVCALDADDRLERTWLEKAAAYLDAHPATAFVSHWLRSFGDESADWTPTRCDLEALLVTNTINGAALVRREALLSVGGYDESLTDGCEDWDLWLSMVERGMVGSIIPEVLFFYRKRPDSMSRKMSSGDRFHALLAVLIRKHETSYRQHISRLVTDHERELIRVRREVHTHRIELVGSLFPQLLRSRQTLERLRAKAAAHGFGPGVHRQNEQSDDKVATLQREQEALRGQLEHLTRELDSATDERDRLRHEFLSLRASLTWRLTQPARAFVDLLRGTRGSK